jgi:hypothetical protein
MSQALWRCVRGCRNCANATPPLSRTTPLLETHALALRAATLCHTGSVGSPRHSSRCMRLPSISLSCRTRRLGHRAVHLTTKWTTASKAFTGAREDQRPPDYFVQALLDQLEHSSWENGFAILKSDFRYGFNEISKQAALDAVQERCPEQPLQPVLHLQNACLFSLGEPTNFVWSSQGVRMGCPLDSFGFDLGCAQLSAQQFASVARHY